MNFRQIIFLLVASKSVNGHYGNTDGKTWFRNDIHYINKVWQLDDNLLKKVNPFHDKENVWLKKFDRPLITERKPKIIKHWNKMIFNWEWESTAAKISKLKYNYNLNVLQARFSKKNQPNLIKPSLILHFKLHHSIDIRKNILKLVAETCKFQLL